MALMRYVGPYPEVRVVVAGTEVGNVENGGSIVVPDELASQAEWSEHWEDGSKAEEKKKVKADEKAVKDQAKEPVKTAGDNERNGN